MFIRFSRKNGIALATAVCDFSFSVPFLRVGRMHNFIGVLLDSVEIAAKKCINPLSAGGGGSSL